MSTALPCLSLPPLLISISFSCDLLSVFSATYRSSARLHVRRPKPHLRPAAPSPQLRRIGSVPRAPAVCLPETPSRSARLRLLRPLAAPLLLPCASISCSPAGDEQHHLQELRLLSRAPRPCSSSLFLPLPCFLVPPLTSLSLFEPGIPSMVASSLCTSTPVRPCRQRRCSPSSSSLQPEPRRQQGPTPSRSPAKSLVLLCSDQEDKTPRSAPPLAGFGPRRLPALRSGQFPPTPAPGPSPPLLCALNLLQLSPFFSNEKEQLARLALTSQAQPRQIRPQGPIFGFVPEL